MAKSSQTKFCSVACRKKNLNETNQIVKFESPMKIVNLTSNNYTFAYDFVFSTKRSDWITSSKMRKNRKVTEERNEISV